ncbi:hypothetical protein ACT17S_17685 [Glutamicibacter mysorens]
MAQFANAPGRVSRRIGISDGFDPLAGAGRFDPAWYNRFGVFNFDTYAKPPGSIDYSPRVLWCVPAVVLRQPLVIGFHFDGTKPSKFSVNTFEPTKSGSIAGCALEVGDDYPRHLWPPFKQI